jgi:hypothetical protein
LAVSTPDGVREVQNRRAVIEILRAGSPEALGATDRLAPKIGLDFSVKAKIQIPLP